MALYLPDTVKWPPSPVACDFPSFNVRSLWSQKCPAQGTLAWLANPWAGADPAFYLGMWLSG